MVAKTIGKAMEQQSLPIYIERFGTTVDEVFVTAPELRQKFGDRFNKLPVGAIGFYTCYQQLAQGLRQLMAGRASSGSGTLTAATSPRLLLRPAPSAAWPWSATWTGKRRRRFWLAKRRSWWSVVRSQPTVAGVTTMVSSRVLFVAAAALLLTSCAKPVPYPRGQAIPLGNVTVTVSHAESMSPDYAAGPVSPMAKKGQQILVVYFRISRMNVEMARSILSLRSMFSLIDGEGHKYRGVPLAAGFFNQMRASRSMETMADYYNSSSPDALRDDFPTEWVLMFAVPESSRGFTLVVNNSHPLKDQPRKAAVDLGR